MANNSRNPIKVVVFGLLIFGLVFMASHSVFKAFGQEDQITLRGKTMGTTYHVKYIDKDLKLSPKDVQKNIDDLLKIVNQQMSTYIPNSELSRFNQFKEINTPFAVSEDLAKVVAEAIYLNKVTDGALDVTVGPLVNLWGFGPEKRLNKAPTKEQILARQKWIGVDKLKVLELNHQYYLEKSIPQLYVDLSSIAKGFGVDKVAQYLESLGIQNYLVEIGGEIFAKGVNEDEIPWQIAIEKPRFDGQTEVETVIGLNGLAMATSGNYRNYFEQNGKRFSHEIDPKTGETIQHRLASISVIAKNTMIADGLSTGLFVLGEDKALAVAEKLHLPVFLIIKNKDGFEVKMSSYLEKEINKD